MNTYKCFWKSRSIEVRAATTYEAQKEAARLFRAKKSFEVNVVLVGKGDKEVTHTADF